jgi:hypothetical protein
MKKIPILLFAATFIFAQGQLQYEKNLNLGNSNEPNYTIVEYDCLWDLADRFYGNPFQWRYIWEHNPDIEDPHWIYPGDLIFIPGLPPSAVSKTLPPSSEISLYDNSKTLSQINSQVKKTPTQAQLALVDKYRFFVSLEAQRQTPFIFEAQVKRGKNVQSIMNNYGKVVNNGRPLLVQNKDALVKITLAKNEADELVKIGKELGFYTIRSDLKSRKGVIIEPVAMGKVRSIDKNHTAIYVDKLWGQLAEGAIVAALREPKSIGDKLTYKTLQDNFETQTVARMSPNTPVKPFETLFLDKGEQDGVAIGDHFVFYVEANRKSLENRKDIPIFEGLVVLTEKNTATLKAVTVRDVATSDLFYGVRQGKIIPKN